MMFDEILNRQILDVTRRLGEGSKLAALFANCYPNTLMTTTEKLENGEYFVFTGDIPAMWLRDSSAQVRHYLPLAAQEPIIREMIAGLCRRQTWCILQDPYANAFNKEPNGACWAKDETEDIPLDWERKYEVDSLCYPIQLAYLLWKYTGETSHLDKQFEDALQVISDLWILEQDHSRSSYYFIRRNCPPTDTLPCEGRGNPVAYTGMTWSGFRPSDDACCYGYLIPSNMFAAVTLEQGAEIAREIYRREDMASKMLKLSGEIRRGIETYGIVDHPEFGKVYAYEADGLGHHVLMDDANVPSLLSAPYLGYCAYDDPVYLNTRRMILSPENPYYYEGSALKGIGSPHTPPDHVWHIALSMQGLTSTDPQEMETLLDMLVNSDGDTGYMHEGVHKDDPSRFTRSWFAWSNSLFSEFILHYLETKQGPVN
ncbi:MAG: glycoside hydrolase family 125 protein [Lachnospiraceae bacterium]|nr:glycoside hydrolase family 125 protein [Lachnospiraceae bacterium]